MSEDQTGAKRVAVGGGSGVPPPNARLPANPKKYTQRMEWVGGVHCAKPVGTEEHARSVETGSQRKHASRPSVHIQQTARH